MSMPGFTGDVTLYRTRANYNGAPAREGVRRGNVVIPQEPTLCYIVVQNFFNVCDLFGWKSGECDGAARLIPRACA